MTTRTFSLNIFFHWLSLGLVLFVGSACSKQHEEKPILRVGTSGDYEPFSVRGANGNYSGFDIELAKRFAADQGFEIEFVPFKWPDLLNDLNAGKFEVAMSGVTVRADRSLVGTFTVPITTSGAVVVVPAESSIQTIDAVDHSDLTIGVNNGGHLERVTRKRFKAATIITVTENQSLPGRLLAGEIDCLVTDTMEAPSWLSRLPGARALPPFTQDLKACFVSPERRDLTQSLNAWLLAREQDGSMGRWREEHLPGSGLKTAEPLFALLAAMRERLSLMSGVAEAKRALGRPVEDLEQEARVLDGAVSGVQSEAARAGLPMLDENHVRQYFQAQMDVAKAIQQRVLDEPATPSETADLVEELRPALGRISNRLNGLLLQLPPRSSVEEDRLMTIARELFEELPVSEEEISVLVEALIHILR